MAPSPTQHGPPACPAYPAHCAELYFHCRLLPAQWGPHPWPPQASWPQQQSHAQALPPRGPSWGPAWLQAGVAQPHSGPGPTWPLAGPGPAPGAAAGPAGFGGGAALVPLVRGMPLGQPFHPQLPPQQQQQQQLLPHPPYPLQPTLLQQLSGPPGAQQGWAPPGAHAGPNAGPGPAGMQLPLPVGPALPAAANPSGTPAATANHAATVGVPLASSAAALLGRADSKGAASSGPSGGAAGAESGSSGGALGAAGTALGAAALAAHLERLREAAGLADSLMQEGVAAAAAAGEQMRQLEALQAEVSGAGGRAGGGRGGQWSGRVCSGGKGAERAGAPPLCERAGAAPLCVGCCDGPL